MEEQDDGRLKIVEELQLERDSQEVNLIRFFKNDHIFMCGC